MSLTKVIQLLVIVGLVTAGQTLFKMAASRLQQADVDGILQLYRAARDPVFLAAITVYAVATVLWVMILRDIELSRAYPFVAFTYVLVPLAGVILLGEDWSPGLVVGTTLIVAGLCTICRFS